MLVKYTKRLVLPHISVSIVNLSGLVGMRGRESGAWIRDEIVLHVIDSLFQSLYLPCNRATDLSLLLKLLLQGQNLISLALFLQISEPVPESMKRISLLSLTEEV